jgi:hypothetical protein
VQVTESAAAEKLKALRDARGSLLIAQRRVADAENRLTYATGVAACVHLNSLATFRYTRNCSALMGAGEFSTIKTANLAMIQATRQLMVRRSATAPLVTQGLMHGPLFVQVSQAMHAGTAAESKACEGMGKKDYAGILLSGTLDASENPYPISRLPGASDHWKAARQNFGTARSSMANEEDSESAAVPLPPPPAHSAPMLI